MTESPKTPIWESKSADVEAGYTDDLLVDYSNVYNYLLERNYPFIVAAGEFDGRDGALSQHLWMKQLLDLTPDFWDQDRQVYYYSVDGLELVGGYWTDNRAWGGAFTLMTIPKSGHFAPYDNYYTSIHIL